MMKDKIKVYLAGPDIFKKDARDIFKRKEKFLIDLGLTPVSPIDSNLDTVSMSPQIICSENIKKILAADAIVADLVPFRGPSVDPGTAFEMGFVHALGLPIYAYSSAIDTKYKDRAQEMIDLILKGETPQYPIVEDFDLIDNLMIAIPPKYIARTFEEAVLRLKLDSK